MGLTFVELQVGNPANPEVLETIKLLVDSGAIYSVIPTALLEKLGIKPIAEETFFFANGDKIIRKKGIAFYKFEERLGGSNVIFGEEGDHALLGVLTLESLGLSLDPLRRELKPLPMLLA